MMTTPNVDDERYTNHARAGGLRAFVRSAGSLLDVRSAPLWRSAAVDEFTGGTPSPRW